MEQAALHRMATSIAQLTLCQVTSEEIETATKLLEKACQKLRGIWKYTLPCIQWACATFPACNWHGGYALMFLTTWLNGTLEMMQNDVETSEFEYRSKEIWLFLDDDV